MRAARTLDSGFWILPAAYACNAYACELGAGWRAVGSWILGFWILLHMQVHMHETGLSTEGWGRPDSGFWILHGRCVSSVSVTQLDTHISERICGVRLVLHDHSVERSSAGAGATAMVVVGATASRRSSTRVARQPGRGGCGGARFPGRRPSPPWPRPRLCMPVDESRGRMPTEPTPLATSWRRRSSRAMPLHETRLTKATSSDPGENSGLGLRL